MARKTTKTRKTSTKKAAKRANKRTQGRRAAKTAGNTPRKAKRPARKVKAVKKARRGRRMDPARGWRLSPPGAKIVFAGTLLSTVNAGKQRLAIFSVPKRWDR